MVAVASSFLVGQRTYQHSLIPIWVPFSWTLRMSEICLGAVQSFIKRDKTPMTWTSD